MNNFSPLPATVSNPRLSTPEAAAPAVSSELQARRQKLRRVVTWIVGGATALMCVGLICGAVRSHYRNVALAEASAEVAQPVTAPTIAPSVPATAAADTSTVTAAAPPAASAPAGTKPAKKLGAAHVKGKHASAKSPLAHH